MDKVLGITLPLRRGANGYFNHTIDPRIQVQTNLTNLLLTQKGERPMQPTYGSTLAAAVFEADTTDGLAQIHSAVISAVEDWMPFISIEDVKIKTMDSTNEVLVNISYKLLTNNITDSITLRF